MMNKKHLEDVVDEILSRLVDEIPVDVQVNEMLATYPEEYRQEVIEAIHNWMAEEMPIE